MIFKLLLLFVLVPLIELFLLFELADLTSNEATLALIIMTGLLGSVLARSQGLRTFLRIRAELASGTMPTDSLVDALMIFAAGTLLLTPGILTDLFGFSLLMPICRRFYRFRAKRWFSKRFKVQAFANQPDTASPPGRSVVIDSYIVDSTEDPEEPPSAPK